jgi:two-component system nitrogen regulation response regulator GlnG
MRKLLIIDDEPSVCYSLEKGLAAEGLAISTVQTAGEGLERIRRDSPDAVLLDLRLPDMSGLEACTIIRQIDARLPVIVITAHGTMETAIEAMKLGAFEYLLKPLALRQLRDVVARAIQASQLSRLPAMVDPTEGPAAEGEHLVGRSRPMQELYKSIGRIAPQDVTVLIFGQSGSGKELVARAIYQHSRRSQGPFVAINCAAIPEPLLESELFGHERGAFTGADRRRIGKFEQADGGTILMDEIGDMSLSTQAKLLRLLQEQRFERLGGNATIQTNVRLIAATNQDLESLVDGGRFRQDLYYRLKVLTIRVPPLAERLDDLPLLVEHFLGLTNRELDRRVQGVAAEVLPMLQRHPWRGNVRELQSAIKYALIHCSGDVLTADCFPADLRESPPRPTAKPLPEPAEEAAMAEFVRRLLAQGNTDLYDAVRSFADRIVLPEVLQHVQGSQVEAARILGISRTTLRARLRELGLVVEKQVSAESGEDAG